MRALLSRMLLLLGVIALIAAIPLLTGYSELRQARTSEAEGKVFQADAHYERAAHLLPWRPGSWEKVGIARFHTEDLPAAITFLEREQDRGTLSDQGWYLLGLSYWKSGDHAAAIAAWGGRLEESASFTRYYEYIAGYFREYGDVQVERSALERWIEAEGSDDAWGHYRLGQLLSISQPDRALREFLQAASLDPQYDPAVESMRTALNLALLETDDSRRLVIVGRGLGILQDWTLAAEAFRQAISLDRSNAEAWAWLGEAEGQLGLDGRAELDTAVSLEPGNPIVHSLRGLYWMRRDQPEQALQDYQRAAGLEPHNPAWRISIAEAHSLNGDLQAALQSYLDAIEIAPSQAIYWRLLADFCARYDMQVEEYGLPAAQAAIELSPEDPLVLDSLGWILVKLERYDEAQDALEHALSLDPELALPYLHLGLLALHMDDWETAREDFRQAQELDPDGPVGEQAKRLLDQYFP